MRLLVFLVGLAPAACLMARQGDVADNAGKPCTDGSECLGRCLPPEGAWVVDEPTEDTEFPEIKLPPSDRRKLAPPVPGAVMVGECSAEPTDVKNCGAHI